MSSRAYYSSLLAVLLVAAVAAIAQRFMLDDAYIALRYARNLVEGNGLVWNLGERVEGYTSPLWTLLLALPLAAGADPVHFIYVVGPVLLTATLASTAALAQQISGSRAAALVSAGLLASNPSMTAFATGGLETQLLAALLTTSWVVATRASPLSVRRALVLSLLSAACLLARLDSALAVGAAGLHVLYGESRRKRGLRTQCVLLLALLGPCALILGGWFAWTWSFYGRLLPNTFYAKAGASAWAEGARFIEAFLSSYLLWPSVAAIALGLPRVLRQARGVAALAIAILTTYVYIASVGGDFMEFRFFVPTLPLLFVLLAVVLVHALAQPWLRVALVAIVVAGAVRHGLRFRERDGIESITQLASHLDQRAQDWIGLGQALGSSLPQGSSVTIALTAAGAIPYYSRLRAVDMLGLTDAWIARHGVAIQGERGHRRIAPLGYLMARGVHLVFGHPMREEPSGADVSAYMVDILLSRPYFPALGLEQLPKAAGLVEIPVGSQVVLALLLRPHPDIERAVRVHGWRYFALLR